MIRIADALVIGWSLASAGSSPSLVRVSDSPMNRSQQRSVDHNQALAGTTQRATFSTRPYWRVVDSVCSRSWAIDDRRRQTTARWPLCTLLIFILPFVTLPSRAVIVTSRRWEPLTRTLEQSGCAEATAVVKKVNWHWWHNLGSSYSPQCAAP